MRQTADLKGNTTIHELKKPKTDLVCYFTSKRTLLVAIEIYSGLYLLSSTYINLKTKRMKIPLNIISDGGPFFMTPLILFIFLLIILCVLALRKAETRKKYSVLISHISLFALVWGFLGSTLGLIQAFDTIESVGDISNGMMAGGLKIALLTTLFGLVTFLIGRFCMILITLKSK